MAKRLKDMFDIPNTEAKILDLCKEKGLNIKVMGVPKTVDNDLAQTDHSLGFPSAAKYVINTVKEIIIDAKVYKKGKVYIIEIMGRNAGWLTAATDLLPEGLRPDLIYLPEQKFDMPDFLERVKTIYEKEGNCIVAISEGIEFERDMSNVKYDSFGHAQLGGAGADLAKIVEEKLNAKIRAIELSLPQRAFSFLTSKVDSNEAVMCGRIAVKKAIQGMTGHMIAIKRVSNNPYKVEYQPVDLANIANVEQKVPVEWIKDQGHMSKKFKDYLFPLIQGEIRYQMENGVIKSTILKKEVVKSK